MITSTIQQQMSDAMRAKDEVRLSTLRMLLSALNYAKIELQHDLSEEEELKVVAKEAKKRQDAIDSYTKVGATERADSERGELAILKEFLPEQLSEDDLMEIIRSTVSELKASGMADMGKVIGAVKSKVGMKADGSIIAQKVKDVLIQQ